MALENDFVHSQTLRRVKRKMVIDARIQGLILGPLAGNIKPLT